MTTLQFAYTHNLVVFLTKSAESEGFEQIVDFINASSIKYALTVNPTIYTSCIEQFWSAVKEKTVNREVQLQALVDGKKIVVTEASVRRDLQLEDADGVDCLPNATIFEQLTLMGPKEKDTEIPQSSVPSDPTNVADEVVIEEPSMQLKELMDFYTKLQQRVLNLENTKTAQAQEIASLKKRVKKLEKKGGSRTHKLKILYGVGRSKRVVSSEEESLGDQEDASKQGRIYDIDADKDIYLVNVHIDEDMFGANDLEGDEIVVESEVADKDVNLSVDEVTLAQALAALKSAKVQEKGDVIKELSVPVSAASTKVSTVIPTIAATTITAISSRPRAKGIVFHEQEQAPTPILKKMKKKGLPGKKLKKIQAKVEADYQLAQRLQALEQEELSDAEKATLFVQLLEKRRKHFAAKRAEEKRNRTPTKA
ncbi:hypothetical protein Tco_0522664 [Tanacetum coccineum]